MTPVLCGKQYDPRLGVDYIGLLSEAISCIVTEERNGQYELEMQYPTTGRLYSKIDLRSIILAKPSQSTVEQPFRIYRISKPVSGVVTLYAQHISYDLSGYPVQPFMAAGVESALRQLKSNAIGIPEDTVFSTDLDEPLGIVRVTVPSTVRSVLGGTSGSILDKYGGEYQFDGITSVRLLKSRGKEKNIWIKYGLNLLDLKQERNCTNVYTGLYPYWRKETSGNSGEESGGFVQLTERVVPVPDMTFDYTRILPIDFSGDFEAAPSEDELRARALTYIKANDIGAPNISVDLSFAQLDQTLEYSGLTRIESIDLCDTINILIEDTKTETLHRMVTAKAKVTKTIYDALLEKYNSLTLTIKSIESTEIGVLPGGEIENQYSI